MMFARMGPVLATVFTLVYFQGPAAAQVCPCASPRSQEIAANVATGKTARSRPAAVPILPESEIRVLSDTAGDAPACHQLLAVMMAQRQNTQSPLTDLHWTFYEAGSQYYVILHRISPSVTQSGSVLTTRLGTSPVFVVDSSYEVVARFAQ
jgi:hypothetical protein